jgi:hypothetical protein
MLFCKNYDWYYEVSLWILFSNFCLVPTKYLVSSSGRNNYAATFTLPLHRAVTMSFIPLAKCVCVGGGGGVSIPDYLDLERRRNN